jgi:hypothetical protein
MASIPARLTGALRDFDEAAYRQRRPFDSRTHSLYNRSIAKLPRS